MSRGVVSEMPQVFCSAWQPVGWDREVHYLHGSGATSQESLTNGELSKSVAQWCVLPVMGEQGLIDSLCVNFS